MIRLILLIVAMVFSLIGFSQRTVSDSLVAHYPFSGNANDATGNGYDGTVYGATLTEDRFGNTNSAYEFDGVDDYINTFSTFDFEFRTMSLWVQPYDIQGNETTDKHIAGQDANTLEYGQLKAKFSNGNLLVRAGGETSNYVVPVDSTNTWYHLVLVRDGTVCKYYLNNNRVGTSFSGSVGSSIEPNENFVIGVGRKLINQFFIGKIDDIRIYNRVLSTSEIDSLFSEGDPELNTPDNDLVCNNFEVYPNPVREKLYLKSECKLNSARLFDSQGKLVIYMKDEKEIPVNHLASAVYILLVETEKGDFEWEKIVVSN